MAATRKTTPIDDYLRTVPVERRGALADLRAKIRSVVPEAEECISYGMPAFRLPGGVVAGFQATRTGGSYYPHSGSTLATVARFVRAYSQTKSALHFTADEPLPSALVRRLIAARRAEMKASPRTKTKAKAKAPVEKPMKPRIFAMSFASVYPLYVQKAEKKGRTKAEVDEVIAWLTGYQGKALQRAIDTKVDLETFFAKAPRMNPKASLITGVVCGVRVEEVADPLMQKIRYLDKLVDELARGKPMASILR